MAAHNKDTATLRKLIVPEQYPRIEAWLRNHPDIASCPMNRNPLDPKFWDLDWWDRGDGGGWYEGTGQTSAHWDFTYTCMLTGSRIVLKDMILRKFANDWIIVDWRELCYSKSWSGEPDCE